MQRCSCIGDDSCKFCCRSLNNENSDCKSLFIDIHKTISKNLKEGSKCQNKQKFGFCDKNGKCNIPIENSNTVEKEITQFRTSKINIEQIIEISSTSSIVLSTTLEKEESSSKIPKLNTKTTEILSTYNIKNISETESLANSTFEIWQTSSQEHIWTPDVEEIYSEGLFRYFETIYVLLGLLVVISSSIFYIYSFNKIFCKTKIWVRTI